MPINLWTGLPGHGKTASMMDDLMNEVAKHAKGAPDARQVVAAGIDGLNVDGVTILDDPREWNAIDPDGEPTCTCDKLPTPHAHVVPDGALIYVDEAWKYFGHLQEARGPTPPHVLQLAEHRHRGIDFRWTTQMPNQLYPFARSLVGDHVHVVRRFGTHFIDTFKWGELNEDVKSISKRENAQRSTTRLPARVFDKYKSATIHTVKPKLPLKLFALPIALLLAVGGIFGAMHMLKPKVDAGTGGSPEAALAAPGDEPPAANSGKPLYTTWDEYAALTKPLHPSFPWTAPAYSGRAVVSEPRVFCSLAGAGLDAQGEHVEESCHCKTEQGTDHGMHPNQCRNSALKGEAYNPFRAPVAEHETRTPGGKETGHEVTAPSSPAAVGVGDASNVQEPYGGMRASS